MTADPAASVVVATFDGRDRVTPTLAALLEQDLGEPYEVIVVDSGAAGCAELVAAAFPEVRVVRSRRRLNPGQARNRGVDVARGRFVAFVPDDCIAPHDWLRRRVGMHRSGFAAVGGAIANGTPGHPLGTASYYLEYSAVMPSARLLAAQPVPHGLSYERRLFDRLGRFPEGAETGEDTVFNERCVAAGVSIGFDPGIRLAHRNPTRIVPYLRHQYGHGRGLVQCVDRYALESSVGPPRRSATAAMLAIFGRYPARRWWKVATRVARDRPASLLSCVALSPLIWAGLVARSLGAWAEWRATASR